MEICCLEECGADSVRPMLVAPRCIDNPPYHPCLPACTKTYYCCDKPPKPKHCHRHCIKAEYEPCSPPNNHQDCYIVRSPSPSPRSLCCEPCESHRECKPTKTKYIMPCYRYEDGRIANQPTVLMRRACEVAVGKRPRKKPYEESRFVRDPDHQESRYIREDEETTRRPKPAVQSNGKTKIARIRNKTAIN
ncbi:uncharacterized protein LOC134680189 isoform X2 [Cydia fagiglandana]|uniref:uncharacterized protein LOC134680189 isoform X2 n=1 Tax=Cydia fagiglandana TaxID=1458189 RepID=UPI002FEDFE7C